MRSSIKCPKCHTWNDNLDYCSNCNELLNYQIKREQEIAEKKKTEAEQKDKVDLYLERIKNSEKLYERLLYWALRSVWFLIIGFAVSVILFTALGPG